MPASAQKQFAQMIPIEARKYIPVPISEVALDWWVIPKSTTKPEFGNEPKKTDPQEKLDVLLVAIHNETCLGFSRLSVKHHSRPVFLKLKFLVRFDQWPIQTWPAK
jgi:hypothetical protein